MISQRRAFFSFCFLFSFLLAFPILAAQVTHTFYPIGDTFIKDNGQNENEGLNTSLRLQQPDRSSHILLKFSQSNILNVIGSSQVVSANLKLYIETNFNNWGSGSSVDVHRMTEGWEEYISGSPAQGATWNCSVDLNLGNTQSNCTMQWEGGSYESTVLSSVFHQNGQTGWKVFNVTNDVQLIQNGSTHYGWLLRKPNPANQGSLDYTSIQGSASYKPRLEVIVDTTPSTITATVNPQPNSYGWNNTNVTVTFTCSDPDGIASCTSQQLVQEEGSNQIIPGTAVDTLGITSSTNVTVNLDKTSPVVEILSPQNGVTLGTPSVNIYGNITETLSGIQSVICNGNAGTVSDNTFSCQVALSEGSNAVSVQVFDVAGNIGVNSISVNLDSDLPPIQILGLNPETVVADSQAHQIDVYGIGFSPNVIADIDGDSVTYEYVDENYLILAIELSSSGLFPLSITDPATGNSSTVELKAVDPTSIVLSKNVGVASGGNIVRLLSRDLFQVNTVVYFDMTNSMCGVSATPNPDALIQAENITYISSNELEIQTPRAIEGTVSLYIENTVNGPICIGDAFRFTTLAFTANQVSQDISVIDTLTDDLFSETSAIPFPQPMLPTSISVNKGSRGGQEIYVVDASSGNMFVFNGATLNYSDNIQLHNGNPALLSAYDLELSEDGRVGYVAHVTSGDGSSTPSGAISVVDLLNKAPIDSDNNSSTTSIGAPSGITRISVPANLVPLSLSDIFAPKLISELQVGNKWPGEYLFTLGVDTSQYTQVLNLLQIPAAGTAFNLNDLPGSFRIAVLDLNPWVVTSINSGKPAFGANPAFRTFVQVFDLPTYTAVSPAVRNLTLNVVIGQSPRRAHVYGYDPIYGTVAVIDFDALTLVSPPTPLTPSHVKFVPSISQDLVLAADSQTGEIVSNIPFDSCLETNHSPTSLAIRSSGEKGYVSSFLSDSVSVIDTFANSLANNCNVSVGERPIQVAVQPVVNLDSEKDVILKQLYFSAPSDFTTSVKQSDTLLEYADVLILLESGTDPEIISAVEEFQLGVEQSVVNTALRTPILSSTKLMKSILVAPAALAAGIPVPHNSAGAWVFFGLSETGPSEPELNKLKIRMDCLKHPYPTTAVCTNMAAHDMTKNGSQFARIWIPWSIFEPCPGKFNTEFFNRIISRTVRSGQKVFITLADVMSPPWFWSASTSGCIASTVPVCSGGLGVGQSNQMKYWDEATNSAKNEDQYCEPENAEMETADAEEPMDECDRHKQDPKSVTSPHISIFKEFKPAQPAGCSNPKRYIKNYINKVFQNVLNNWAPFVIEVQVSLGRLNEPTFPYKDDFWWYDEAAVAYLQEKCGGPPPKENELGGTSEEQKAKRGCYFTNYQKAKQEWVNEVSGWVTNKLKPWQKYVVFPAGGHGDFKYPNPNASNTYYEIAKNNWAGADDNVKQTIRHGRDNYWLLGRARSQGWYAQYAGVQGNGCGPSSNCKWLSDNRNGYSGPLYAQIASLTTDCAQPETVANDVTDNSYFGHVWNKDSHLFESDGVTKSGCVGKSKRELNRLAVGWEDIVFEFGIDRRDTSITNLYVCSQDSVTSTTSATISWETDEPSDSIVLYGKESGYLTNNYMKNVAPNGTNYSYRTDTDHAVTLQGLTKGKKYYFAVFSTDAGGNTSVKEGNFIAGSGGNCGAPPPPPPPTGSPVLESPIETWVDATTPQFVWTPVAGADKYELKILNSAGSVVYPTTTVLNACTATSCSYTLPSGSPLADQTENYSWNLRAHISAGNIWTPWSSARFSVYTFVSVNLSNDASQNSDIEKGLKRPANEPCDGKTIPEDFTTTPSMRKNKGTAMVVNSACNMDPAIPNTACTPEKPCQYIYFDVDERFMSADLDAQHPRVDITVEYFDHKPNTTWATHFCIKYKKNDANHTSACLPVPITNTGTMKTHTFQITNAWFGNTVVGNDLRIECRTDANGTLSGSKDTRRWINKVEIIKK